MISASNTTNRQGSFGTRPARARISPSPPPRPLLIDPSSSTFRFLSTPPWTKTRLQQQAASSSTVVVVCSRNDVCPAPSLVHPRSAPLLHTSSAFRVPRPTRRPVYSSIIIDLFTTAKPSGLHFYGMYCVYVGPLSSTGSMYTSCSYDAVASSMFRPLLFFSTRRCVLCLLVCRHACIIRRRTPPSSPVTACVDAIRG